MKNYAYVSLATSSSDYIKGVLCLQESLKKVGAQYPLVVLITEDLANDEDLKYLDNYKIVPHYSFKNYTPRFINTINKMHILTLEFEKVCFLDADMLIYKNIDYLFDKYNDADFAGKLCANHVVNQLFIEGNIFLIKPCADFFNDNVDFWCRRYQTDEEILSMVLYPKYEKTFQLFSYADYSDCFFHSFGQYKYFKAFKNGNEIKEVFSHHEMSELITYVKAWYHKTYSALHG